MQKTAQNDLLHAKWEASNPLYVGKFIRDGIINEELYDSSPERILFIMKEPNNPTQQAGDFREWFKIEQTHSFTFRLMEWSYGILNDFPPYDEVWKDRTKLNQALFAVAFMNLKKTGGKGKSDWYEMTRHLREDKLFILEQIKIIEPTVIITGFSWKELRDGLFEGVKWTKSGYDIEVGDFNGVPVIDFYHPSSRNAPAAAYSLLENVFRSSAVQSLRKQAQGMERV